MGFWYCGELDCFTEVGVDRGIAPTREYVHSVGSMPRLAKAAVRGVLLDQVND